MPILKGMTWDHSRGFDPMVATAAEYARSHPDVQIVWERRSLQAFADVPLEQLASQYDLLVIDHPHVGEASRQGCLLALDNTGRQRELATLTLQSLGGSHQSYQFNGHQWALAIDAATQVACYRPDLLSQPPTKWNEVIELAKRGKVLWPIKPVDALMSFFTLTANLGTPCRSDGGRPLIDRPHALAALNALADLARHVPEECLAMNPIETYEWLVMDEGFAYCPLGYGYTNYSRDRYRKHLLRYANIPTAADGGPRGSTIGGAGIAVSARCKSPETAVDYAFWIASADCQRGLYFDSGGQPGNAAAWDDPHCNAVAHNFFRDTRATLDAVYLRPRYDGYMNFQDAGGDIVNAFLARQMNADMAVTELEREYEQSVLVPSPGTSGEGIRFTQPDS